MSRKRSHAATAACFAVALGLVAVAAGPARGAEAMHQWAEPVTRTLRVRPPRGR